jgi:hypothetical protein
MVFGPPQHGPLGWLTTPQVRTFYEGPLRVTFDFTSGPIRNNVISKFQTVRSGLYAEGRRLDPMAVHIRGALFSPALKGGTSRAHSGD